MTDPPVLSGCDVLPPMEATARIEAPKRTPKHKNRFAVLNTFVDETAAELTRGDIMVWLVLYRDTRNGIARTGQSDIARRAGISERQVRRVIDRLEKRRLLKTVYRGGLNRGPSRYRVFGIRQ